MATTFPGFLNLSREEANKTLQNYKNDDGKFLIRPSTTSSSYTISVVNGGNIMKYPVHVNQTTQHFYVNQARQFPRMQDLINFYRNESISNNAQVLLREPINGWPRGARGEYGVFVRKNDTTPDEQPSRPGMTSKPSTPGMASKPGTPGMASKPGTPGMASKPGTPGMASKPSTPGMASKPSTTGTHKQESVTPINGQVVVHRDLPRDMVARVFEPFMNKNGSFLIRPSSTSDGKLTLCVSYNGSIVNFKISKDNATNMYRITAKSFSTLEELVSAYRKHPIKSKVKQQEIYLTEAIPISAYATKVTSPPPTSVEQSVPEPWVRYHDKNTKKFYYYNKETKKTQWDPPVVRHHDLGPLPPVPGKDTGHGHRPKSASLPGGSPSMKRESPYASRPLPALPDQNNNQKSPQIRETHPSQPPKLPMKETYPSQPPTLPMRQTHSSHPPALPTKETHSSRPPALPTKETRPSHPPTLPTKETRPSHPPALPTKETHSSQPPALPTRETHSSQPPALPTKETHSSQPPALPTRESRFQRRNSEMNSSRNSMMEKPPALPAKELPLDQSCPPRLGEQAPPKMQPVKSNSVSNDTVLSSEPPGRDFGGKKKPPPLPQKEKTPEPPQNRVPSPPQQPLPNGRMSEVPSPPVVMHTPPSPGGVPPPPPPPPPVAPPSPLDTGSISAPVTPTMNRSRTVTANDLANMRGTLKRAQVSEKKAPQMSGIGGALSKALDQRRVYVQESDSECEEAEDDDWDD